MNIRQRIEQSRLLARVLARFLSGYLRLCYRTTKWQLEGLEDLRAALGEGPVILVGWHSRLMGAPLCWPYGEAELFTLRDPSPAGNLSAATQERLGSRPISMHAERSNMAASRAILRTIRSGGSLGLTADGPMGPARAAKKAPIEWARASARPVFLSAWSAKRHARLDTWDRMMLPLPFTSGVITFERWTADVPAKLGPEDYRQLQARLSEDLDRVMHAADRKVGVSPGP